MPYISTETVAAICKELKAEFPTFKFSVTKEHHMQVAVSIMKADIDFTDSRYLNYEQTPLSKKSKHIQVNEYHISENWNGKAKEALQRIAEIMNRENGTSHEDGDYGTIPYYYTSLSVGKWDKEFEYTGTPADTDAEFEQEETEQGTDQRSTEEKAAEAVSYLTGLERNVLRAYKHNDIVSDNGWDSLDSSAWVSCIYYDTCFNTQILGIRFVEACENLRDKGIITGDLIDFLRIVKATNFNLSPMCPENIDDAFGMTEFGIAVLAALPEKEEETAPEPTQSVQPPMPSQDTPEQKEAVTELPTASEYRFFVPSRLRFQKSETSNEVFAYYDAAAGNVGNVPVTTSALVGSFRYDSTFDKYLVCFSFEGQDFDHDSLSTAEEVPSYYGSQLDKFMSVIAPLIGK